MVYKVYLRGIEPFFMLPMKPEKLFETLKKETDSVKHKIRKASFFKVYPIISIKSSRNEDLEIFNNLDKRISVILFNYYLLVNKKNNCSLAENADYSNEFIISEIGKMIEKDISHSTFEEQERDILDFLVPDEPKQKTIQKEESKEEIKELEKTEEKAEEQIEEQKESETENNNSIKGDSILDNVAFSTSWIKKATKKLKEKREGEKNDKQKASKNNS